MTMKLDITLRWKIFLPSAQESNQRIEKNESLHDIPPDIAEYKYYILCLAQGHLIHTLQTSVARPFDDRDASRKLS